MDTVRVSLPTVLVKREAAEWLETLTPDQAQRVIAELLELAHRATLSMPVNVAASDPVRRRECDVADIGSLEQGGRCNEEVARKVHGCRCDWRPVPGTQGYKVSSDGWIQGPANVGMRGPKATCTTGTYSHGYRVVHIGGKRHRVHRLVALAFIGPPPDEGTDRVNHKNGVKDDNRLENLEWVSASGNADHAYEQGLVFSRNTKELWDRLQGVRHAKVVGFENAYVVTEDGEVYDMYTGRYVKRTKDRLPTVQLYQGGFKQPKSLARIVCSAFHGPPPNTSAGVQWIDGNIQNVRAQNLAWDTSTPSFKPLG